MTNTISHYFNSTKTFNINDILNGTSSIIIYYLNQLNGYVPFRHNCTSPPEYLLSEFDDKFQSSPHGPDVFEYEYIINDRLYKFSFDHFKRDCPGHVFDGIDPTSKKVKVNPASTSIETKKNDRRLFDLKPSKFRLKEKFTNFDFKNEFMFPDDHFAVPFTSNLDTISDENGISSCKFACLNADEFTYYKECMDIPSL